MVCKSIEINDYAIKMQLDAIKMQLRCNFIEDIRHLVLIIYNP